jgi:hypothetical protein
MLSPEKLKNEHQGDEDGWQAQKFHFTKTKGSSWSKKVCGMSTTDGKLAYLGLNSPTSRHARGRQQSRSVTSVATHTIHGRRSGEHNAVQIPWHIWFHATFHPHLKLDLMTTCTQAYDTTRAGKATVKVRDIHGHPCESHGWRSRADDVDHLIPCHIWGASVTRVHCSAFEVSFLCSILECPHQHSPCTHNIRNQYKYSTTIVLLPSSLSHRPSSSQSRAISH